MTGAGRGAASLTAINGLTLSLILCAASLYASEAVGALHATVLGAAALYERWRWSGKGGAPEARRPFWEAAAFGMLFFFVADLFLTTRNLIGAALRLLVFIVCYQADNPQTPRGARQTLGLTFIQMLAAAASTTEVGFSLCMALYLLAALYTLSALGAAEREDPVSPLSPAAPAASVRVPLAALSAATTPAVVALGLAVFFCVPHYGTGYFRETGRSLRRSLTGFSDRIELGSIGSIKKSHATVMRLRLADAPASGLQPPLPLRLRGIALDLYDGRTWSLSESRQRWLAPDDRGTYRVAPGALPPRAGEEEVPAGSSRERRHRPEWLALEVLLEPLDTRVLFMPPDVVTVTIMRFHSIAVDRQGSVFVGGSTSRRFTYRTVSALRKPTPAVPPGASPPEGAETYLQLPALDPRIEALARDVTRGIASPADRAQTLERHLRGSYEYSLDVNDAEVASPLTHFLIERKPGHCEYFATGLAILLRTLGTPARVVNGFHGGERSDLTRQIIIRQSDAHSWVEAWIPNEGWMTLDPTPPEPGAVSAWDLMRSFRRLLEETEIAWDTWIVGLDIEDQGNILEDVRDRVDLALAGLVIRARNLRAALEAALGDPGRAVSTTVLAGLGLAAAAAAFYGARLGWGIWRRRRRGVPGAHPATILYIRFEKICARRGLRREPIVSPAAFARSAGAPEVASAYETARYGPAPLQRGALERLRRELTAIRGA